MVPLKIAAHRYLLPRQMPGGVGAKKPYHLCDIVGRNGGLSMARVWVSPNDNLRRAAQTPVNLILELTP
jgi:hypothetical protein